MIRKFLLGINLLAISSVTHAAPIYLNCMLSSENAKQHFSVKLDESNGKITHTRSNGSGFNAEGFFSANSITYKKVSVMGIVMTYQYSINRSTLAVHQLFEVKDPNIPTSKETTEMNGVCKIVEVTGRKI